MQMTLSNKLMAAATLGLGLASLCSIARAGDGVPTQVVRYADLNVANPEGALVLYRRIQVAARLVCRLSFTSDKHLLGLEDACFKRAVDEAVAKVDSSALTQIHGGSIPRLASR